MRENEMEAKQDIERLRALLQHANARWCATVPGYFVCAACGEVCVEKVGKYDGMCEQCYDERNEGGDDA